MTTPFFHSNEVCSGGGYILNSKTIGIKCPVCLTGRIIDAFKKTDKDKIIIYNPKEMDRAEWFVKCPKCKNQIGIGFRN